MSLKCRVVEKNICLTLLEGGRTLSPEVFKATYGAWVFDDALQHVAVRRLVFGDNQAADAAAKKRKGRNDMKWLFDELYKKGVRNIIKVVIDDLEFPSHSDESIEKALENFDIEILNWKKVDICPVAIQRACRKAGVVELHLWWSGNNGILRAWAAEDGLAELPRLEHIYLHQTEVSISNGFFGIDIYLNT